MLQIEEGMKRNSLKPPMRMEQGQHERHSWITFRLYWHLAACLNASSWSLPKLDKNSWSGGVCHTLPFHISVFYHMMTTGHMLWNNNKQCSSILRSHCSSIRWYPVTLNILNQIASCFYFSFPPPPFLVYVAMLLCCCCFFEEVWQSFMLWKHSWLMATR